MSDKPKTLREMRDEAAASEPLQIAGKPAALCPYCGCGMLVEGTPYRSETTIRRYVQCRNESCGRVFESKQAPAVLVREVNSRNGKENLLGLKVAG